MSTGGGEGQSRGFSLVEVIVALVILSIGLLGVGGLIGTVATQTRTSAWRSDQSLVAQEVIARTRQADYADVSSMVDTLSMGGLDWQVTVTVTEVRSRLKEVDVEVEGRGSVDARTFTSRVHRDRPLPGS